MIFLKNQNKASVLVTQSCLILCAPWTVACQAPLSMEFSRQEYWSELSFSSQGDLRDPGIEPIVSYMPCIGGQILYPLSQEGSSKE